MKLLKNFNQFIRDVFGDRQQGLDAFIASRNPQNAAEVDCLLREYEARQQRWRMI
jgi:hypothetical protein